MSKSHSSPHLFLALFFAGLVTLGIITWSFFTSLLSPVNPNVSTPLAFTVNKGDSVLTIGSNLTSSGLLRNPLSFRLAVYLEQLSGKIQAGDYQLAPNMSARTIARALTKGYRAGVTLTIPEGYRLEQIAELAESKLGIKYQDFLAASKGQEGYLFPDTYELEEGTSAQELVALLSDTWEQKLKSNKPSLNELILASIIERETLSQDEKPIVAGILQKRLVEGWPLEVDATIQYLLGKKGEWWPIPLLGDRELKSPYNSYLNKGLPPAPICNPGLDSLRAAMNPTSSPYYFYLHDKQGNIHYATTNAEHESNIAKYIY